MRTTKLWLGLAMITFALSTGYTSNAEAQANHIDGARIDVHLDLAWYAAFGLGFRVDIPIVEDGLIDSVDDELAISPGAELFFFRWRHRDGYDDGYAALWPLIALQWNFYLDDWSLFPELGLVFVVWDDYWDDRHGGFIYPFLGLGARYHFNSRNALLMRINWPAGFQIGITF